MTNNILKKIRPLPLILSLAAMGVTTLAISVKITGMDVYTLMTNFGVNQVTFSDLKQGKIKPILLIDVRDPDEYDLDHIQGSFLIPLTEIESGNGQNKLLSLWRKYQKNNGQNLTVVLYCTKGVRSAKAYKLLEKTGLNLVNLKGGITTWRENILRKEDKNILNPIMISQDK
ncbi:MAG TPA: rhodanese-like domain-containing protein [Allocoleopsis sp.]